MNSIRKTVIRVRIRHFYGLPSYAANVPAIPGGAFSSRHPGWISLDGRRRDYATNPFTNPFPSGYNFFAGRAPMGPAGADRARVWAAAGPAATFTGARLQSAVEYQHPAQPGTGHASLEIAYAGNKGTRLSQTYQFNQLDPSYLALGDRLLEQVPNPFFGVISSALPLGTPTIQYGNLLRPYPQYSGVSATNAGYANSNYHALQMRYEKRFSAGLSFLAAYAFFFENDYGCLGRTLEPGRSDSILLLPKLRTGGVLVRSASSSRDQQHVGSSRRARQSSQLKLEQAAECDRG